MLPLVISPLLFAHPCTVARGLITKTTSPSFVAPIGNPTGARSLGKVGTLSAMQWDKISGGNQDVGAVAKLGQ